MVSEGVWTSLGSVSASMAPTCCRKCTYLQVVGRFVRMQEGLPKPQRAWLSLPKDPVLVRCGKRIKAESHHLLEDIMPAGQRDLFGRVTVSTTST